MYPLERVILYVCVPVIYFVNLVVVETISASSTLAEIGVDSLSAAQFCRVLKSNNVDVEISRIFEYLFLTHSKYARAYACT